MQGILVGAAAVSFAIQESSAALILAAITLFFAMLCALALLATREAARSVAWRNDNSTTNQGGT
jgi:hypothetical protein